MITLVKFIENPNKESNNKIITKTLGKFGVFDNRDGNLPEDNIPKPLEFWKVEITKELVIYREGGVIGGCFILNPISTIGRRVKKNKRNEPDISYLVPGGYKTRRYGHALVIIPKKLGLNWVCGLEVRRHLRDYYHKNGKYELNSFVVSLDGTSEWPLKVVRQDKSGQSEEVEAGNLNIYSKRGETPFVSESLLTPPPGYGAE
jgi:hypothetical protein